MAPPKGHPPYPGGGRPIGSLSKAQIERRIVTDRIENEIKMVGKKLAKERLEEMMELSLGYAKEYQPMTPTMLQAGAKPNANADMEEFKYWLGKAGYYAVETAKYQSPQYRAIAVVAQDEQSNRFSKDAQERMRRLVELTVLGTELSIVEESAPDKSDEDVAGELVTVRRGNGQGENGQ